nr:ornithine cyclodeaminase family protein [Alicyclobacillus macrosporangiidus]
MRRTTTVASYRILRDSDVYELLSMSDVIRKIEDALREKTQGTLIAPPRFRVETDRGALVFTTGAATGSEKLIGFRVYDTFPGDHPDRNQIVAVFSSETGALKGIVIGHAIGILRTGAIGGVAVKYMARPDVESLAVLGTGQQARTQLEAALAVRDFRTVKVFSRSPEHRRRFVDEMSRKVGRELQGVDSARACVEGADVILCATSSSTPVFDAEWVKDGAHINTVGPKYVNAHEIPPKLCERSAVLATDSLEQLQAYPKPHVAVQVSQVGRITELSDIVTGKAPGRRSAHDVTLFFSVGLAGTEVVVAGEVLRRADERADL